MPWVQPYPDSLPDELAAGQAGPEAVVVSRETISLAFLAAIQLLPPRQRAPGSVLPVQVPRSMRSIRVWNAAIVSAGGEGAVPGAVDECLAQQLRVLRVLDG
jgi:hypothetical protein